MPVDNSFVLQVVRKSGWHKTYHLLSTLDNTIFSCWKYHLVPLHPESNKQLCISKRRVTARVLVSHITHTRARARARAHTHIHTHTIMKEKTQKIKICTNNLAVLVHKLIYESQARKRDWYVVIDTLQWGKEALINLALLTLTTRERCRLYLVHYHRISSLNSKYVRLRQLTRSLGLKREYVCKWRESPLTCRK